MTDNPAPAAQEILSSSDASASGLYQRVAYQLHQAGFNPRLDEDEQLIVFTLDQGDDIVIMCDDEPSSAVRVFGQWAIDPSINADESARMQAALAATEECKLAKVFLSDGTVVACVDHLVQANTDIAELISVCVSAILFAVHTWHVAVGYAFEDEPAAP